jgi:mannose-1-phosphate guanylyltransferase/mannose-6-phosphate isomerase
MASIQPVILAGGSGTRLWPASRLMYPKQFLPLAGENTMLQETVLRLKGVDDLTDDVLVICNETHRFLVAEQLRDIGIGAKIVLEPEGRNTAPAVALAALIAADDVQDDSRMLLVLPADHVIRDVAAFHKAVATGKFAAQAGKLVAFGIVPTRAETGYGYIQTETDGAPVSPVKTFVEKPDLSTAKTYLESGEYFWNSGMFMFNTGSYVKALEEYAPEILVACRTSVENSTFDADFTRPGKVAFLGCPSDSIDYAIMEKSRLSVMVPLDAGWSDIGSWAALHDMTKSGDHNNTLIGDVVVQDCRNSYIRGESRLVAAVGLEDVVVVETKDTVLVTTKNRSQDVKHIVDDLIRSDRDEAKLHRQVFRPWGSYDSIDGDDGFQVKRLIVNPGAVLSLQKHARRAEHWTVVRGEARITLDDKEFDLNVNESTYIPIGAVHRIANPYDEPVHIIEVQCGDYLGEDDIVRLKDNYGREGTNT